MKDYILTVGLEMHAELSTRTKMFCDSKNDTDESHPNVNVCPICMGHPGTLPVINKEAVKSVLKLGLAVGGEIADYTEFDRKNYFYPDIPKGYQISQYQYPLVRGGSIVGVPITRIHLEEDTAKSIHPVKSLRDHGASNEDDHSLLDFNRAGVPLVELVTEPAIHDPETTSKFAREFQLLLTCLGIAHANMEKGEMRVEANISVSDQQPTTNDRRLGTKVEVKNLNSFRSVEKAIKYEYERQVNILERGDRVVQETRGWDDIKGETFSHRAKEESHDYRYFPDPDLPKLFLNEIPDFAPEALRRAMPELPQAKRDRYKTDFGLKDEDVEIYVREPEWGSLFESTAKLLKSQDLIKLASNYITSDLKSLVRAESLAGVITMVSRGTISSRGAKDILKILEIKGGDPKVIAEENNLIQENNMDELKTVAEKIIKDNPEAVQEYKKGKLVSLQFLIGQAMKVTKGSANPQVLKEIFTGIL